MFMTTIYLFIKSCVPSCRGLGYPLARFQPPFPGSALLFWLPLFWYIAYASGLPGDAGARVFEPTLAWLPAPQLISSPSHWGWLLLIYWLVLLIDVFDYFVLFSIFVLNLLLFLPTSLVQHFLACFNWFVSCLVRRGGPEAAVQFLVAAPFTIPFFFRLMCECKCHGCFKLRTLLLWFVPAAW